MLHLFAKLDNSARVLQLRPFLKQSLPTLLLGLCDETTKAAVSERMAELNSLCMYYAALCARVLVTHREEIERRCFSDSGDKLSLPAALAEALSRGKLVALMAKYFEARVFGQLVSGLTGADAAHLCDGTDMRVHVIFPALFAEAESSSELECLSHEYPHACDTLAEIAVFRQAPASKMAFLLMDGTVKHGVATPTSPPHWVGCLAVKRDGRVQLVFADSVQPTLLKPAAFARLLSLLRAASPIPPAKKRRC